MTYLRLTGRLAWRELRARPWRTLLVALFVAVPVAGMVVFDVGVRSYPADDSAARFGRAELQTYAPPGPVEHPSVEDVLPEADVVRVTQRSWRMRSDAGGGFAIVWAGPLDDPAADGLAHLVSGRLPREGEAAIAPSLRRSLHVSVGDRIAFAHLGRPLRVVGEVVDPRNYRSPLVVTRSLPPQLLDETASTQVLVDLPGHPSPAAVRAAVARIEAAGLGGAAVRAAQPEPALGTRQVAVNWGYVAGALVLLVAGIVIAAAFAVGARRQLRTLGLLGAAGAPPSALRDVLLLEGALSGAVGVVLGGLLAVALLVVAAPRRDWLLNRVTAGWSVHPLDLVPIVLLGVAASVLASIQPARAAGRVGVLGALAGQAPSGRVPRWAVPTGSIAFVGGTFLLVLASGAAGTVGGTGVTLVAILGGVGVVLGATALTPSIVQRLEPLAGRLHGTWRLAARSLTRSRARSSAVVAALAASAALALVVSAGAMSGDAWNRREVGVALPQDVVRLAADRAITPDEVAEVAAQLDHPTEVRYAAPAVVASADLRRDVRGALLTHSGEVAVATPALARFLRLDARGTAAVRAGRAVVVGAADHPTVALHVQAGGGAVDVEAVVADGLPADVTALPRVLLPPSVVDRVRASTTATRQVVLLRSAAPVDGGALWNAVQDSAPGASPSPSISWGSEHSSMAATVQAVAVGSALAFALVVLAVGLGLSAAESKAERDVLVAVGAGPRSTRGLAGAKAVTLAVVGGVLAVPTALIPVYVVVRSYDRPIPFRMPWLVVGLLVVVVPAVAGALTWACSAVASRVRPVRASTFALD